MIDAVVDSDDQLGNSRPVTVTLMETGPLVFEPSHPTTTAANGVEVAHPIDIMACKIRACASRGAANDYCDLAAMLRVWPGWCGKAVEIVRAAHFRLVSVCAAIISPPDSAVGDIPLADRETLAAAAVRLLEGLEHSGTAPMSELGYDPRPNEWCWKGTVIPPVLLPLAATAERERIGGEVWWRGPPWTILRNGPQFVRQVMDFGSDEATRRMLSDVPRDIWHLALTEARPGLLSRGSKILWSTRFGLQKPGELPEGWPDDAHIKDIRPLAGKTRSQLYSRHAHYRSRWNSPPVPNCTAEQPSLHGSDASVVE